MSLKRLSQKQLVDYIKNINVSEYAANRNYLGGSTRISEYLTRGFISLPQSKALRVLLIDEGMFGNNKYSQNVLNSIMWFAGNIKNLYILCDEPRALPGLNNRITRKEYPGIADWPRRVEKISLLYPDIPEKFYPSFSSFWKQLEKLKLLP